MTHGEVEMKHYTHWRNSLIAGMITALPMAGFSEFPVPKSTVLPDSLVTVSVPDLQKTIDAAQTLMDNILPEDAKFDLKAMLGEKLGDPGLKGIPAGNGAAWVWDGGASYAVLECSPEAGEKIAALTAGMHLLSSQEGNLVIVSKLPAGLDAGKKQAAVAARTLLERALTGVVINLQTAKLVEHFRPQINMMMMMMPNMMAQGSTQLPEAQTQSMRGMAKFVEGEIRVLVSLATQIEHTEISLLPQKDAVEYAFTFSAREGTNLHALITAPETVELDPMFTAANLQPGMMTFEIFLSNPEAILTFIKAESDQLAKEMLLDQEVTGKWNEMMELWPAFFSGSVAETVRMDPEKGFSVEYMVSVQDPVKVLTALESISELMKPFMAMYANMGMPMAFDLKMNARKHGDASIHQYNFSYDLDKMDPMVAEQIRVMNMAEIKTELTVTDNRLLWTMGESSLDALIDRVQQGLPAGNNFHAHELYPKGGFYYYDMDMGQYFSYMINLMPKDAGVAMFGPVAENLKGKAPITGAGYQQENRVYMSSTIPLELIRQFVLMGYRTSAHPANPAPIPVQIQ
jgi:hypothetical protein